MLKKFAVENFKNFQERIVLDLSDTNKYTFNSQLISNNIAQDIVIFGKNGSGKSNLCYAIIDIINNLTNYDKTIPDIHPMVNLNSDKDFASFHYEFAFSDHTLTYDYKKNAKNEFLIETLKIDHEEYIHYNYQDDCGFTKLPGTETLNTKLDTKTLSFVKYVAANSVLQDQEINNVFLEFIDYVKRMLMFYSLKENKYYGYTIGSEDIMDKIVRMGKLKDFEKFLCSLELPCQLESEMINGRHEVYVIFTHGKARFYDIASTGTKALTLFYYWLIQASHASLIIMDEFDAFYHYELSKTIVKTILQSVKGQAIFTSHNTGLMNNTLFRPDCLYILSKKGLHPLSHLTDKELREAHNLQKMYKAGAFDEEG